MEEPLGAFEAEATQSDRGGSFARGALIALPLALAIWGLLYWAL